MMTPEDQVQQPAPSKFHDPITERIERRHLVDDLAAVMAERGFDAAQSAQGVAVLRARGDATSTWAEQSEAAKQWGISAARPFAEYAVEAGWRPTDLEARTAHDESIRVDTVRKVARSLRTMARQAKGEQLGALLVKIAAKIEGELTSGG